MNTRSDTQVVLSAEAKRLLWIEILDLHARGLLRMPWIQALIVAGIGLFIVPSVSLAAFLFWAPTPILAEVLRASYARSLLQRRVSVDPKRAHWVFVVLAAFSGFTISAGAILFFPQLPPIHQALLGATLFALPAAGVAVSSSRYILSAYAVCVLIPASITWGYLHPSQALALTALSAAYCLTIFAVSADGEKLVLRSVLIRQQRDQLVQDLESRNAEVLDAVHRAELAAQAKARVLASASHDLRQPLHALSLYSAVLAADPTADTVQELSRSIDQIVRSLGSLLSGLLDLSRLSAAHYVPEQEIIDLHFLLMQVCDEYQQPAAQKGLRLIRDIPEIHVKTDPVAIGRIVRNLVDNAIKYTDRGSIAVRSAIEPIEGQPCMIFEVADTGRGIERAEHERIFEEFYQIDNPGRDHGKGVGLGLAIVRRLCELLKGSVTVSSMPGAGTQFRVCLPACLVALGDASKKEAISAAPAFLGKRILVVDDELEILRSMKQLLCSWSAEVSVASSTRECEQVLELDQRRPDLLIVDLRLNEEQTGADLANRLLERFGAFPILIVTGETSSDALVQANRLGCPLLQKPIAAEVLRGAIADALQSLHAV